jgi:hypothetical protein
VEEGMTITMEMTGPTVPKKVKKHAPYLVNSDTMVVYGWTEDLANNVDPRFIDYYGVLPPPDLDLGQPKVTSLYEKWEDVSDNFTPEQRIRIIAGCLPILPKDDFTQMGEPALFPLEELSKIGKITRKEVNAAQALRAEMLRGRSLHAEEVRKQKEEMFAAEFKTIDGSPPAEPVA